MKVEALTISAKDNRNAILWNEISFYVSSCHWMTYWKKKPTDDHLYGTGVCWIHLSTRNLLTFSVYESAYFYIIAFLLYKSETLSNKVLLHVSDMFS